MKRFLSFLLIFLLGVVSAKGVSLLYPQIQKAVAAQSNGWVTNLPLENPYYFLTHLPKSNKKKSASVPYAFPTDQFGMNSNLPIIQDVNGDGLPDIFLSWGRVDDTSGTIAESALQYVLINNGSGFTMAYGCVANNSSSNGVITNTYQGDCADYN